MSLWFGVAVPGGFLLVALLSGGIGYRTLRKQPEPGSRLFTLMVALTAGASVCSALLVAAMTHLETDSQFLLITWDLYRLGAAVAWPAFVFTYVGWARAARQWRLLLFLPIGCGVVFRVVTMPPLDLDLVALGLSPLLLDWFWDNTQRYASLLLLGGAVLLVFYGRELESLPVRFSAILSVGAVSSTAILHLLPLTGIPITAALGLFTLTGMSYFVAYEEYRLFDRRPSAEAIGREVVVGEMPELVVVVDSDEQILDMNPAAQRALGATLEECLWHRVSAVFDKTLGELRDTETITVEGTTTRYYDVSVAPVAGGTDRQVGHAIVLHDITDERRQQQRLGVLNRILRHNVRNDMTVVIGLAETIAAGTQPPEKAGGIVDKASELTDISQKARTLESMMAQEERNGHIIDLSEVVREAATHFDGEYESVDVRLDCQKAHIQAIESTTEAIVENLVENACEHNDSDEPWVEVTVAEDDDEALVRVTDNGPGLPDHERETVLSGEETDLQHGSGLGLWIVVWGVEQTGGDLVFDTDRDGTTITVRFPRSEPASESQERPLLEY